MKTRVITAVVALAVFIPTLVAGGVILQAVAAILAVIAMSEVALMRKRLLVSFEAIISMLGAALMTLPNNVWNEINTKLPVPVHASSLLYIFVLLMLLHTVVTKNHFNFEDAGVFTLAMMYVGMGFHFFVQAREAGLSVIFYGMLIVWLTDSGAYLIGRKIGKTPLAPRISPNKTWEGSIGGTILAMVIMTVYVYFFPQAYSMPVMILLTGILSVAGQYGDLIESGLKRFYKVKDSGTILPGHGGILDRFDSMLIVMPILFLLGGLR
ncbi:phosphatidate cytidylyltransferase [Weissella diestrammenae]|uniref:Phosphatidate cytidylyltransferase n=1 Tax=Weissella diestrammenae TaxID=1162633 RepID=A0A7G9T3X2_9LACO|nr:phosphatidate cytidylyltransferase [Weissella diestrammenae]MCM0582123.1 phosphatidate cytidylyltransferase [Weissella diestrammenae]QNN74797.1 phosphatidate cytidylyltransferase [Weissella diestrammenae]